MRLRTVLLLSLMVVAGNSYDAVRSLTLPEQDAGLLREAFRTAAACQLAEHLQLPMDYVPLYAKQGARCEAMPLRSLTAGQTHDLFTDERCQTPVSFRTTPWGEFCLNYVREDRLGDARNLAGQPAAWTLTPATRLPLPVETMLGHKQPFMQRLLYRQRESRQLLVTATGQRLQVRKGSGQCALEMRVFKRQPAATGLMPLLLFSGGGLQRKALHSLALQSRISRFTDAGFIVFIPFLRSISGGEGPEACRDASWQALTEDASDALQWVRQHGPGLGARAVQPALMAQGSGALLATWLSIYQPESISRTLLLYPLVDTASLLAMAQSGRYSHRSGINLLERLAGKPIMQIASADSVIQATSLLRLIRQRPAGILPRLHILHGTEDQRIPVQQSRALCSAWRGREALSVCGETLFLLEGAGHQLDYCVPGIACPAGNEQHRAMVRLVLKRARCWLKGELDETATDPERMCTGPAGATDTGVHRPVATR